MIVDTPEQRFEEWRAAVLHSRAVDEADADELEGHLREQVADLEVAGRTPEVAGRTPRRRSASPSGALVG